MLEVLIVCLNFLSTSLFLCVSSEGFSDTVLTKVCLIIRCSPIKYEGRFFYVRRVVDLMKAANVNTYNMYIFGKIELLLYTQPNIISKSITLMTSKMQSHTYISDTGNIVEKLHL